MLSNYVKIAFRNLIRHRLYTAINAGGLAVGLACAILIMLFVHNELSYDRFNGNADSIFRILTVSKRPSGPSDVAAYTPMPMAPALRSECPGIARAARLCEGGAIISAGDKSLSESIFYTDPDIFSMFDIEFIRGNPSTALTNPSEIVMTEPMALKYFGTDDVLGKTLTVRSRKSSEAFTVAGVVREMPPNSSVRFDFLVNIAKSSRYDAAHNAWAWSSGSTYIQLAPGSSAPDLGALMPGFVNEHFAGIIKTDRDEGRLSKDPDAYRIELQPLAAVHLDARTGSSPEERGNPAYLWILSGIGLFVLLIACINFTTLTIARAANRGKEVGMRKVLGAVRFQLVRQFLVETLLLGAFALAVGIALAELALPTFNELAEKHLGLVSSSGWFLPAALAGLLAVASCVAGIYPALHMSRFVPAEILKGKPRTRGRNGATRALVVLQFSLSIFLIAGTVALSRQLGLLMSKDLGYRGSQVLILSSYAGERPGAAEDLIQRLRTSTSGNPGIVSIAGTSGAFTRGYDITSFPYKGRPMETFVYRVDENYIGALGITLKEGRNFIAGDASDGAHGMIVNEAFVREFALTAPVTGTVLNTGGGDFDGLQVVGVARDFHFRSLREEVHPVLLFENAHWPLDDILVRIAPEHMSATVEYLREAWKTIAPGKPFDSAFLDEEVQKQYRMEMKWGSIVTYASALAVALACLGLFGLVTLSVGNRTKEIGVRKVLGASARSVVGLISWDFIRLVLVANAVAWPAAYFALRSWLQEYASRIDLGADIFIIAGGAALGVALLTISLQVVRAALSNPVESLRYE